MSANNQTQENEIENFKFSFSETRPLKKKEVDYFINETDPHTKEVRKIRIIRKITELDIRKKEIINFISSNANAMRNRIVGDTSAVERDGWGLKAKIAERYLSGEFEEEELYVIETEAHLRGLNETPEQLAQKQIAKSKAFALASVTIDGFASYAKRTIEEAETISELLEVGKNLTNTAEDLENRIFKT